MYVSEWRPRYARHARSAAADMKYSQRAAQLQNFYYILWFIGHSYFLFESKNNVI